MVLSLRALGAGFALITTSFNQAAEPTGFGRVELSVPIPLPAIAPPTEDDIVQAAANESRSDFLGRVSRNDTSGKWNRCFSTGRGAANYSSAVVRKLRSENLTNYTQVVNSVLKQDVRPAYNLASFAVQNVQPVRQDLQITKPIIVVDFGHGQLFGNGTHETGTNIGNVEEAKVADAVGTQLVDILRTQYNAIVVTTRAPLREGFAFNERTHFKNQDKSLQIRAETAAYLNEKFSGVPKVFISLHVNKAEDGNKNIIPGIHGGLVFSYSPVEGGASASVESRKLAKSIAAHYSMRKPTEARTNDYAVLRCQHDGNDIDPLSGTAAALLELGFNSNPGDNAVFRDILKSETTARSYASGIAEGIGRYIQSRQPKPLVPNMQVASAQP